MNKLHIFTQCRIDGEDAPEVIPLGKIAISLDEIIVVSQMIDKHDCIMKDCVHLGFKGGQNLAIKADFAEIIELFDNYQT